MPQQGAQPMASHTTEPSQALTHEGRGEISTLSRLRRQYPGEYITVDQLLSDHLQHLGSLRALRNAQRNGRIKLDLYRLRGGRRAPLIVYLTDLADYLDQAEKPAAYQAA